MLQGKVLRKPVQAHVPLMIGAGGGPKTFAWIAAHADGWMTTPREQEVTGKARALRDAWTGAGRPGRPEIAVLANARPSSEDLAATHIFVAVSAPVGITRFRGLLRLLHVTPPDGVTPVRCPKQRIHASA